MTYGQKNTQLRKQANMTQGQLGELLNVSSQAVSKWEHDLSEPDLGTIKRMALIFKISVDEFLDISSEAESVSCDDADDSCAVVSIENIIPIGYCSECGIAVREDNFGTDTPRVLCKKCFEEYEQKRHEDEARMHIAHENKVNHLKKKRTKSIVLSSIFTAIALLFVLLYVIVVDDSVAHKVEMFFLGLLFCYAVYSFVTEIYFMDTAVLGVLAFFLRSPIKLPGLIFELSLDGCLAFFALKIILAVVGFVIGLFLFCIGLCIAMAISPFIFPFTMSKINKKISGKIPFETADFI